MPQNSPTFKLISATRNTTNKQKTETNNMASIDFSDDSSDTNFTQTSLPGSPLANYDFHDRLSEETTIPCTEGNVNVVNKLISRQVSELT